MYAYANHQQICVASPAKLNLFLELLGRRQDGFHELETVMVKFPLYDNIIFAPNRTGQLELSVNTSAKISADAIPSDESNLVIKTLAILRDLADKSCGATIRLFKRIPVQAGMGGASGNAAAAILAANRMWNLRLTRKQMGEIAGQIGSDVAFFLGDSLAKCTGKGEKVHYLDSQCRLNIVVVKPAKGLSTKEVYARCHVPHQPQNSDQIVAGLTEGRINRISNGLFNRLGIAVETFQDDVGRMSREFERTNVSGHQLTGSGSCYFGIYRNRRSMLAAAKKLANRLPDMHVFTGQTLSSRKDCLRT